MRPNSLAFRLTASAAIISIILFVAAGVLLADLFKSAVERNFDERLHAVLDGLLSNVDIAGEGQGLAMQSALADTRFSLPLSGWYWQVTPLGENAGGRLVSASLLDQVLAPDAADLADRDSDGVARFYLQDVKGTQLRGIEQRYRFQGRDQEYSILVAGNFDELKGEIWAYTNALVLVLAFLGLGFLGSVIIQVRYGLRPLNALRDELNAIREGQSDKLVGAYPEEIEPVARELNLMITANAEIVERARTQVGNLAHALKTPLSVLTNEGTANKGALAQMIKEQAHVMRDQISLYLDRARRAARARSLGASTSVKTVVGAIARTLGRIHQDRDITVEIDVPETLRFRGEQQDLEEMIGNLLDNSFKWATRRIAVRARPLKDPGADGRIWLEIMVEDDGPGLPADRRAEALKRGRRLDETKPGSGLGLSIVSETASMYSGKIELNSANLGGLRTTLTLPAILS
ncbi:MAG TPA: sensor histidine kinase [Aestuariivirgaceae bacterium]|nr:sensor histidine kinase [Aestuariivirgaceae bacterium]